MKHRRILGVLLAASSLPALGAEYLPPQDIALLPQKRSLQGMSLL